MECTYEEENNPVTCPMFLIDKTFKCENCVYLEEEFEEELETSTSY